MHLEQVKQEERRGPAGLLAAEVSWEHLEVLQERSVLQGQEGPAAEVSWERLEMQQEQEGLLAAGESLEHWEALAEGSVESASWGCWVVVVASSVVAGWA